jgi:hypothetical protein
MGKILDIVVLGEELIDLRVRYPHQRLLQLLYNILMKEYGTANLDDGKLYNLTDDKLLEVIKKYTRGDKKDETV